MFDEAVLNAFIKQQGKLFDEPVCETPDEADAFLEDVCAVVCDNIDEVVELLEEEMDISEIDIEDMAEIEEVFEVGDGRYLVVEG